MSGERVKPDGRLDPQGVWDPGGQYEGAFRRSTILRVIDEEIDRGVIMPYHDGEDPPSTIDVLEALRARFEEADDGG